MANESVSHQFEIGLWIGLNITKYLSSKTGGTFRHMRSADWSPPTAFGWRIAPAIPLGDPPSRIPLRLKATRGRSSVGEVTASPYAKRYPLGNPFVTEVQ